MEFKFEMHIHIYLKKPQNPCITKMNKILMEENGVVLENDVGCTASNWGPWGPCYKTCGRGYKMRQRSIRDHPYITSAHTHLLKIPNFWAWADKKGQKM